MTQLFPLHEKPALSPYKKGDVLVLFGELFSRGYANGLVEEAERRGMTIVRATVGRREKDGSLRALTAEETANIPQPFINVPLEAGFDMEPDSKGVTPCDQLKDIKMGEWDKTTLDWKSIEESEKNGTTRFRKNTELFLKELEKHIPAGANVLFAHLMAGGVPRAKILMPLLNRAFKGTGDRHIPTQALLDSQIGQFSLRNFKEVTAETFRHLVELSTPLRKKLEAQGNHVSYTAYGYHGTEVMIRGHYKWQTYTCYFQGWAKMALEQYSEEFAKQGVHCCVYNCPEILTNSSSVFQGVEVSLYPLLAAIQKDAGDKKHGEQVLAQCKALLKDDVTFDQIIKFTDEYLTNDLTLAFSKYEQWPQHSRQDQMEYMLKSSDYLFDLHKDQKNLITAVLSEVVFKSCGYVMLHDSWQPKSPVAWIGHDLVARCM
ncbi:enoyl ACP reductase FabMG family protein [Bdellovibrio sp. BCCA]|uniref:enoyl ACP reductase FabMG family protein n=1 Tax=Bdellovibrio sp. BCCA TaxID=3136281 RepID=UPI0030F0232D